MQTHSSISIHIVRAQQNFLSANGYNLFNEVNKRKAGKFKKTCLITEMISWATLHIMYIGKSRKNGSA